MKKLEALKVIELLSNLETPMVEHVYGFFE